MWRNLHGDSTILVTCMFLQMGVETLTKRLLQRLLPDACFGMAHNGST